MTIAISRVSSAAWPRKLDFQIPLTLVSHLILNPPSLPLAEVKTKKPLQVAESWPWAAILTRKWAIFTVSRIMEDSWEKNSWIISLLWMCRWGSGGGLKKGGGVKSETPNSHTLGSLHSPADTGLATCIHELPCSSGPFKSLGNLPGFLLNLVF